MRERQEAISKGELCRAHWCARIMHTHTDAQMTTVTRIRRKQPLFSGFYFEDLWRGGGVVAEGVGGGGMEEVEGGANGGEGGNNA